jgi:hypothetical protein
MMTSVQAMATIYRKTVLGAAEIATRAHKLTPPLRSLLILVDGKRSDAELRRMLPDFANHGLEVLVDLALVEAAAETAQAPVDRAAPAQAPSASATAADLPARRRTASRELTDAVGPHGEELAMRIERARTADDLRRLIGLATQAIMNMRGRAAAEAFAARFADL